MKTHVDIPEGIRIPALSTYIYDMAEDRISESHPEFHKWIHEKYPKVENWVEKLYLFYNGMDEQPRYIGECGTEETPMFLGLYVGYKKNDCGVCRMGVNLNETMLDGEPLNTQQKKYLRENKYGVIGYKDKKTYVCECNHSNECEVHEGCNHVFEINSAVFHERIKRNIETCSKLNPMNNGCKAELRKKFLKENKLGVIGYTENNKWICECAHLNDCVLWDECDHTFTIGKSTYHSRASQKIELCTKLHPIGISKTSENQKNRFLKKNSDWLIGYVEGNGWKCKCTHLFECEKWDECDHTFLTYCKIHTDRERHHSEQCTKLNPIGSHTRPSVTKRNIERNIKECEFLVRIENDYKWWFECTHPTNCPLLDTCDHEFSLSKWDYRYRIKFSRELCVFLNPVHPGSTTKSMQEKFMKTHDFLLGYTDDGKWIHDCTHLYECEKWEECKDHRFTIDYHVYLRRLQCGTELCTVLSPYVPKSNTSEPEKLVRKIVEYLGVEGKYNRRNIIFKDNGRPLELDIFIESLNVAIEFNGSYIHSMDNPKTERNQHILKAIKCAEKGIELITVWEDMPKDLIYYFLRDKFEGKDVSVYKELLHPDLKYNEWSNDLGWYKGVPPKPEDIQEHLCYHFDPRRPSKGFPCYDSGKITIPDELLKN